MTRDARILLASNRGPVSFTREDTGEVRRRQSAGGLASALAAIQAPASSLWICAAISDTDRAVAREAPSGRIDVGPEGEPERGPRPGPTMGPVRMLDIEPLTFQRAYNGIANSTLWFVQHLLFDTANTPIFDARFRREWQAYVDYNRAFAHALAEEAATGARVVVQDYHLSLVPQMLRELRGDLRIAHFSHTPWAPPEYFRMLPDDIAVELLEGMVSADHLGFLSSRWSSAFLACCEQILGAKVDGALNYATRRTRIGVHPLGVDAPALRTRIEQADVRTWMAALRETIGDRKLLVRVDRAELSKNIVRGLLAYRAFLERHPEWRGRVVHLVFAYPSRHDLPEYREYAASVQRTATAIREDFGTPDWEPLILASDDDLPRSLAAYRLADVAVVNPVRDGMNLVAKEVSIACDNGCALVLSREAGAADELGEHALVVNPYDVEGTADAIHAALSMTEPERKFRAERLAGSAASYPPERWLADQLDALDG